MRNNNKENYVISLLIYLGKENEKFFTTFILLPSLSLSLSLKFGFTLK